MCFLAGSMASCGGKNDAANEVKDALAEAITPASEDEEMENSDEEGTEEVTEETAQSDGEVDLDATPEGTYDLASDATVEEVAQSVADAFNEKNYKKLYFTTEDRKEKEIKYLDFPGSGNYRYIRTLVELYENLFNENDGLQSCTASVHELDYGTEIVVKFTMNNGKVFEDPIEVWGLKSYQNGIVTTYGLLRLASGERELGKRYESGF